MEVNLQVPETSESVGFGRICCIKAYTASTVDSHQHKQKASVKEHAALCTTVVKVVKA